jgi:hypothetical protein
MTESIDAEVARTLSTIPVRASRQMAATEYQVRVAEVLNLFDIEAVGDETGIRYGGRASSWKISPWKRPFAYSSDGGSASLMVCTNPTVGARRI